MSDTDKNGIEQIEVPEPWEPIDYLCYPGTGSKAYKHSSGANTHIIDMYDTDKYIAQLEDENGDFEQVRFVSYRRAAEVVNQWMQERSVETDPNQ